jgi:tRNA pseudouridine38-40 synthase
MIPERYALKIFYDGRGFSGSQRQPRERTVEGEFISALNRLKIKFSDFKTAGRTDKWVSSLGNVFAFTARSNLIKPRILNTELPRDLKVLSAHPVKADFNPRHAKSRIYKYFLQDLDYDLKRMKKAKEVFKGRKSFHNFSSTDYRSPIRKIDQVDITKKGEILIITISGESFLWQMVRRMANALKMIGKEEISSEDLERLLEPGCKKKLPPLDPENLVLWDVIYNFEFTTEEYTKKRLKKEFIERLWRLKADESIFSESLRKLEQI